MNSKNKTNDTCGCCKGITALTPVSLENLPGLPALSYRVGTHGSFKTTMIAALSSLKALGGLTIREDDDPSIALIDAWACVLDVLTFYQERIANEGNLLTAVERSSVIELARAIGYELKPGVAASTFLAFTLDNAPGTPGYATIDTGVKVMSIPGQNEKPQTFETIEKIEARAAWNELKPRLTEKKIPVMGSKEVYLKSTATRLKPGDGLLFMGKYPGSDPNFRIVKAVTADIAAGCTQATWNKELTTTEEELKIYAFRLRASIFGYNAPDWRTMPANVKKNYINPSNSDTGLYAEYFNNINPNVVSPKVIKRETQVNWQGTSSPDLAVNFNNFSARWTGFVKPEFTGIYTFYTQSDDGTRLWVDGKLIINNWTDHGSTKDSATISLVKGQIYDIKLEYYHIGIGEGIIKLSWQTPDNKNEIIPEANLYRPDFYQKYDEWPGFKISQDKKNIFLDAVYQQILPDSWLILSSPYYKEPYIIKNVVEDSQSNFTLTGKTTRVTLHEEISDNFDNLRQTIVFAQSEQLDIAETPRTDLLSGNEIELGNLVSGLDKGKILIISGKRMRALVTRAGLELVSSDGERVKTIRPGDVLQVLEPQVEIGTDLRWTLMDRDGFTGSVTALHDSILQMPAAPQDTAVSEAAELEGISETGTILVLKQRMQNCYDPATVTIYANVARATHGETVREVLGSGSGARANQHFMLKKPLTYVSAKTPSGTESTIEVRVNDVKWQEVPSLYGLDARIQGHIIRIDDNGNTTLTFGDGKNGARLTSGQENITATYRTGIGMQGMVKANQLSLLMTRPLGVKGVINPLAPTGAADPETRDQAKQNAPQKVLTLDRIVSLQDFEDFTRAFAGIGKARAAWLRDGEVHFVHITVASADAGMVDKMSELYKNLWLGIKGAKDPVQQFRIDSFNPLFFNLSASVQVDSRYIKEKVLVAITDVLKQAFSFEQRSFGQAVTESEVLAVMQGVEGVIAVDLNALYLKGDMPALKAYLGAGIASLDNSRQILAELLTVNPGGIELTEMRL